MTNIQTVQSYFIGAEIKLTRQHKQQLVKCFQRPILKAKGVLGGRAAISRIHLNDIGPVIVKCYTRGGVLRYFNRQTHLKFSQYRCQSEYELLRFLGRLGVNVNQPVAFAYQGSFFYHAWLVTREIQNAATLAEFSKHRPENLRKIMKDLSRQVAILIENQIHHVDLHPGNVMVDNSGKIYIIDFDKARTTPQNRHKLKSKYVRRWQRAVAKYQLPAAINQLMSSK